MESLIVEMVRAIMAHSECVSLFLLLVLQQLAMHAINVKKLDSLRREFRNGQAKRSPNGDDDAADER